MAMPRSPVRGVRQATDHCFSHIACFSLSLSPSFPFSLKINEIFKNNKKVGEKDGHAMIHHSKYSLSSLQSEEAWNQLLTNRCGQSDAAGLPRLSYKRMILFLSGSLRKRIQKQTFILKFQVLWGNHNVRRSNLPMWICPMEENQAPGSQIYSYSLVTTNLPDREREAMWMCTSLKPSDDLAPTTNRPLL